MKEKKESRKKRKKEKRRERRVRKREKVLCFFSSGLKKLKSEAQRKIRDSYTANKAKAVAAATEGKDTENIKLTEEM